MILILTLPTPRYNSTILLGYVVSNQIKHPIHPLDSRPGGVRHIYIPPRAHEWKSGRVPVRFGTTSLRVREPFYSPGYESHPHPDFVLNLFFEITYPVSNQIKHPIRPLDSRPGSARCIYIPSYPMCISLRRRMDVGRVPVRSGTRPMKGRP